jgi:hypothetical protein
MVAGFAASNANAEIDLHTACARMNSCTRVKSSKGFTYRCLKDALLWGHITDHRLAGTMAKQAGHFMTQAGFLKVDSNDKIPDGSVMVVQPDPKCAGKYGNVLLRCEGKWVGQGVHASFAKCKTAVYVPPALSAGGTGKAPVGSSKAPGSAD